MEIVFNAQLEIMLQQERHLLVKIVWLDHIQVQQEHLLVQNVQLENIKVHLDNLLVLIV